VKLDANPVLSEEERQRFARHLLLPEIGTAGQARLCAARLRPGPDAATAAAEVAADYLARAGAAVLPASDAAEDALALQLPDAGGVVRLAGHPRLEGAAAALAGAFAALEALKAVTGAGRPGALARDFSLGPESAP